MAEFEELQVRIQFREDPDVAKKISDSLKTTAASRRTRVGHITGIPATSSDLTSLVCRVQEKVAEEIVRYSRVSALGYREVGFIGKHGQNPKLV